MTHQTFLFHMVPSFNAPFITNHHHPLGPGNRIDRTWCTCPKENGPITHTDGLETRLSEPGGLEEPSGSGLDGIQRTGRSFARAWCEVARKGVTLHRPIWQRASLISFSPNIFIVAVDLLCLFVPPRRCALSFCACRNILGAVVEGTQQ